MCLDAHAQKALNVGDKRVHPVEGEWHYKYLVPAGFEPETKEGIGFVRSYIYKNKTGVTVKCTTGYSADYWDASGYPESCAKYKGWGYWASLEPFLKCLGAENDK